jgi:hypothetical protein
MDAVVGVIEPRPPLPGAKRENKEKHGAFGVSPCCADLGQIITRFFLNK